MRVLLSALCAMYVAGAMAADKTEIGFNYKDTPVDKVIEEYSKASGQKFIIDPAIKGRITIINSAPISVGEAFNQLSSALALEGLGISKQDDVMVVMQARSLQRNFIDVGEELPSLKPEKMFTWVIKLKYVSADEVNKQLRILTSRDGELVPYTHTNQIVMSDWVSNLYRVNKIIKELDVPAQKTAHMETAKPGDKEKK